MIKISVIVPIYNIEKFLPQCIESIIHQTYQKLEIILVDDGSTDSSGKICDHYKEIDSRIIVIHKKNGGLVSARKAGVAIATGDYVAFVDGDDYVDKIYFDKVILKHIEEYDITCLGFKIVGKETKEIENIFPSGEYTKKMLDENLPSFIWVDDFNESGIISSVWSKIYRKSLIEKIIVCVDDNISIGEDAICTYLALMTANSLLICNDIKFYNYRLNEISMMHKYDDLYFDKIGYLFEGLDKIFESRDVEKKLNQYKLYSILIGCNKEFDKWGRFNMYKQIKTFRRICREKKFFDTICQYYDNDGVLNKKDYFFWKLLSEHRYLRASLWKNIPYRFLR